MSHKSTSSTTCTTLTQAENTVCVWQIKSNYNFINYNLDNSYNITKIRTTLP